MQKILRFFFIGIITALGAMTAEFFVSILSQDFPKQHFLWGFGLMAIFVILIEELFKFSIARKILSAFSARTEILSNALIIGAGFSSAEIFFNILRNPDFSEKIFLSYAGLFLVHTTTLLIFGFAFSLRTNSQWNMAKNAAALIIAGFVHFIFNLTVLRGSGQLFISLFLAIFIIFLFFYVRQSSPSVSLPIRKE